jgi:Domain of unknown function (DUF4338)
MNVLVQPSLDGIAAERLHSFAIKVASTTDPLELRRLAEREAGWAQRSRELNGQIRAYEAAARLLVDLRLLKWQVRADAYGLELESPPHPRLGPRTPESIERYKEGLRRELAPTLHQQFSDPGIRRFIEELENPPEGSKRKSISLLIAEGDELWARVSPSIGLKKEARAESLRLAIQPYLQLVPGDRDESVKDEFTNIPLGEIWRYFRFFWSIPQTAIPGRQMFYLVRDRAHPYQAVIGIACLGNSPLMSPERDEAIGWTPEMFRKRLEKAALANDRSLLESLHAHLEKVLDQAIAGINPKGLAKPREISDPDERVVSRLQRMAEEFSDRREGALREVSAASEAGVPLVLQEMETTGPSLPPVSVDVLELEGKRAPENSPETLARQLLVAKKRAFELARLLRAKMVFRRYRDAITDPDRVPATLLNEDFGFALGTALFASKSDRVGTNILEITTCGAVAPYNSLLGGKLVALMLLSPEVADDYRLRYGDRASIISSQMKNEERKKDCTLAWLNTTSLYSLGSSQYERVRLDPGVICPAQPKISFKHIGDTEGFGTVQFSEATALAVQSALEERYQFRAVNNIFGEGFSPKFRKLRDGMVMLGFNPTVLMRHDQQRRVYSAPLWPDADKFLRGEDISVPEYLREPWRYRGATERIAEFWRARWLASRLDYKPAVEQVRAMKKRLLSDEIAHLPVTEKHMKATGRNQNKGSIKPIGAMDAPPLENPESPELRFWKDLALAGPEVCADELSEDHLTRLHVAQGLDAFLLKRAKEGFSIVLTGNAGDGKTHLLRRLQSALSDIAVETDATAAMRPDDVSPILRAWKRATQKNQPYLLAANEYPLFLLRRAGKGFAPVDEVSRQCDQRLIYETKPAEEEQALNRVIVVDLSLRNPLNEDFVGPLLNRLVGDPDIRRAAVVNPNGDLAWNLRHLSDANVQKQLIALFRRLVTMGHRVTVRELWIWAVRLLFGRGAEDTRPIRSPGRWYSSRLFDFDDRFQISGLLRAFADPAVQSHPVWDLRLESGTVQSGWKVDGAPTLMRMDAENFIALKRRFYFDHDQGHQVFRLAGDQGQMFIDVLQDSKAIEEKFKHFLIESINLAYCPVLRSKMTTRLYLWIGHRYHEQPSHGYVANQSIADSELDLLRPRLPSRMTGAFRYQPDHLLLRYRCKDKQDVLLKIDYNLFVALEKLRQGLPRQLLPDREVNRLDSFIEQLRRADVRKERVFYIHDHDNRTTAEVTVSGDFTRYEGVKFE